MPAYRREYLSEHGAGWKYLRRVPQKLQATVGAAYWQKYLGQMSRAQAAIKARAMTVEHDALIGQLSKLAPVDLRIIADGGGIDDFLANYNTTVTGQFVFEELLDALQRMSDDGGAEWTDGQVKKYLEGRRFMSKPPVRTAGMIVGGSVSARA